MKITLPLPPDKNQLPFAPPSLPERPDLHRLPRVEWVVRKSPLLHTGPLPDQRDVLSLNLAQGCAHRCAFCSVRATPGYRGDDTLFLFEDTPRRLAAELSAMRRRPRAVYISPATDPFMPLSEVQVLTGQVVEVLATQGVDAWLMTRGYIRPGIRALLATHRQHVKVTVGLTTLDRSLTRLLEPLAAPPRLRLRQIAQLREAGVPVGVQVAPLVPGLTDQRANLESLVEALASVGVRRISAGYMFLRAAIRDNMARALAARGLDEALLREFDNGVVLASDGIAAARYLPKARRQRGYAALTALAVRHGIQVSICGLTNPDFGPARKVAEPRALPWRLSS